MHRLISRMIRRASMIAVMAAGLVFTAGHGLPTYACTVQHYLHDFERTRNDLSPMERLVFSLILAQGKQQ